MGVVGALGHPGAQADIAHLSLGHRLEASSWSAAGDGTLNGWTGDTSLVFLDQHFGLHALSEHVRLSRAWFYLRRTVIHVLTFNIWVVLINR